ncbi:MAG: YbaB/EbfC family nucleoid-associated protein [bacterium]|nr:YbaB/EbfC family nucleoid-associated protein [bacterium]
MKGMKGIMKQVQKMQSDMARMQDELAEQTVTVSSGGGMVTVTANGQQEIVEIKIDPEVVNPDEIEMLEDLVQAAVNEALHRVSTMAKDEMQKLTGGLSIPGLF